MAERRKVKTSDPISEWTAVRTSKRAQRIADVVAGLYGFSIGSVIETAVEAHAQRLAEGDDSCAAALRAYLKGGGPKIEADTTAVPGTIGKPSDDAKAAAAKRDTKRSRR